MSDRKIAAAMNAKTKASSHSRNHDFAFCSSRSAPLLLSVPKFSVEFLLLSSNVLNRLIYFEMRGSVNLFLCIYTVFVAYFVPLLALGREKVIDVFFRFDLGYGSGERSFHFGH